MTTEELVRSVLASLNEQQADYMIVGSLATNFYCVPRSTQDVDIVVHSQLVSVARTLRDQVPTLSLDPQIQFESVTATQKALLRDAQRDFDIELFGLSSDDHDQQHFARRVRAEILGVPAWIATAEDMIVTKLRWCRHAGREKDVADARNLISVQGALLDWPYIEKWCERHGTREILDRLRRECAEA
jgi:hypothetical protein